MSVSLEVPSQPHVLTIAGESAKHIRADGRQRLWRRGRCPGMYTTELFINLDLPGWNRANVLVGRPEDHCGI